MALEDEFTDHLVAASVGVFEATSGWSIHIGKMPPSPDSVVLVTHSGGTPSDPKFLLDYPHVQVRVRGGIGNYRDAKLKAQEIKDLLLGMDPEDKTTARWVSVTLLSDIAFLGYDENDRPEFSVNFSMIIEPTTGANRIPL